MKKITKENAEFQLLEAFKNTRNKRQKNNSVFVDDVKAINVIIKKWIKIKSVYCLENIIVSDWAKNVIWKWEEIFEITWELMEKLVSKEKLPELIIISEMPKYDFFNIKIKENFVYLVIDRPVNKWNLWTIIRSANSFWVDTIFIYWHWVDVFDPEVIRSSVWTVFDIPIVKNIEFKEFNIWLDKLQEKNNSIKIVWTSAKANKYIQEVNFKNSTILMVWNETFWLNEKLKELSNEFVKIPMSWIATSLNVWNATSICLYEIQRQRI